MFSIYHLIFQKLYFYFPISMDTFNLFSLKFLFVEFSPIFFPSTLPSNLNSECKTIEEEEADENWKKKGEKENNKTMENVLL